MLRFKSHHGSAVCMLVIGLFYSVTGEVKLVNILFRHGARTPISFYPNDPYKGRNNWPVGPGELTNEGKSYHYSLGKYFSTRYGNLIKSYSPEEFYCRSSNVDRTIMSAQSNLAGFFPPQGNQIWNTALPWQPIPVHSVPKLDDEVLQLSAPCKAVSQELETVRKSQEIKKMDNDNRELLEKLSNYTGRKLRSVLDTSSIYDTLLIEDFYNKTLPNWTKEFYPDRLKEFFDLSFLIESYTQTLKRLRGGPLLKLMIDNMKAATENKTERKVFMYSAHDLTVSVFLNTLGVYNGLAPPFASTVFVELLSESDKFFVKIGYKNSTNEPYKLKLPGCDEMCPLDDFVRLTATVVPDDWTVECGNVSYAVYVAVISILVLLFLVMCGITLTLYCKQKSNHGYSSIPEVPTQA